LSRQSSALHKVQGYLLQLHRGEPEHRFGRKRSGARHSRRSAVLNRPSSSGRRGSPVSHLTYARLVDEMLRCNRNVT